MQGADQHFKMEQETEESDALIEQLCSAMLSFLRDLVKLGPAPVTVPSEGIAAAGQGEHYVAGHSTNHSPLRNQRAVLCCALAEMRLRGLRLCGLQTWTLQQRRQLLRPQRLQHLHMPLLLSQAMSVRCQQALGMQMSVYQSRENTLLIQQQSRQCS